MSSPQAVSCAAEPPFVSVIVPVYNAGESLPILVAKLCEQDYPRDRFEIILVDDGSTDGCLERVSSAAGITIVRQRQGGSYSARNTGAGIGRGEFLAFTDADCQPCRDWLRAGIAAARQDQSLVAGAVEMVCGDEGSAVERFDCAFNISQAFFAKIGFGATANLIVRRDLFDRVGGFDGSLRSGGDQQFCTAAAAHGIRVHYAAEARVLHPARDSLGALVAKTVRVARGRARAFPRLHYYLPKFLPMMKERYDPRRLGLRGPLRLRVEGIFYLLEIVRIAAYGLERLKIRATGSA